MVIYAQSLLILFKIRLIQKNEFAKAKQCYRRDLLFNKSILNSTNRSFYEYKISNYFAETILLFKNSTHTQIKVEENPIYFHPQCSIYQPLVKIYSKIISFLIFFYDIS